MTTETRRSRKYAKGFAAAMRALQTAADTAHADSLRNVMPRHLGIFLLQEMISSHEEVFGESPLPQLRLLGSRHQELSQHEEAIAIFSQVIERMQETPSLALAEVLNSMAESQDRSGQSAVSNVTRDRSLQVLAELIGNSDLLTLYRRVLIEQTSKFDSFVEPDPTAVKIETAKFGQIWWASWPQFPNDRHHDSRPGIVVSSDRHCQTNPLLQMIPLYSKARPHSSIFRLKAEETGLGHDGYALCSKLTSLDRSLLRNRTPICLPEQMVRDLLKTAKRVFD